MRPGDKYRGPSGQTWVIAFIGKDSLRLRPEYKVKDFWESLTSIPLREFNQFVESGRWTFLAAGSRPSASCHKRGWKLISKEREGRILTHVWEDEFGNRIERRRGEGDKYFWIEPEAGERARYALVAGNLKEAKREVRRTIAEGKAAT